MFFVRPRRSLATNFTRCRHLSSLISAPPSPSSSTGVPFLYRHEPAEETHPNNAESTATLQLLSWGRGSSGQLGGGIEEIRLYPSPVANLIVPDLHTLALAPGQLPSLSGEREDRRGIGSFEVGISCGLFHSSLLVNGQGWIWGKGDGGRLGFGHENPVFTPTLNPHFDGFRCIALGGLHSVALNSLGQVFTWGYGGFGALGHSVYHRELIPRLVEGSWRGRITHIATSGAHTAAITESGELYTWGRDEGDGRLGLGPGRGPNEGGGLSIPLRVKALPAPVAAVSCGGFFTMALGVDGKLWNWGANTNFELGRGNKIGGWEPKPIPSLEDTPIIQIASGGYHSLALTGDGKVLSWGYGGHGQLGHSSIPNEKIPRVIDALADQRVIYISCGGSSSAAITAEGKLYMWGNAKDSQLGVPGLPEAQPCPVEVKFLNENDGLGPYHVLSVAVGASHAMCLVLRYPPTCGATAMAIYAFQEHDGAVAEADRFKDVDQTWQQMQEHRHKGRKIMPKETAF